MNLIQNLIQWRTKIWHKDSDEKLYKLGISQGFKGERGQQMDSYSL